MANMTFTEGYYADFKFRNAMPTSLKRIIASLPSHVKKSLGSTTEGLIKGQGLIINKSSAFCLWEDTFNKKPYSNNRLREILAPAIKITTSMLNTDVD